MQRSQYHDTPSEVFFIDIHFPLTPIVAQHSLQHLCRQFEHGSARCRQHSLYEILLFDAVIKWDGPHIQDRLQTRRAQAFNDICLLRDPQLTLNCCLHLTPLECTLASRANLFTNRVQFLQSEGIQRPRLRAFNPAAHRLLFSQCLYS